MTVEVRRPVRTLSVVIPTFERPDYLERCVRSIAAQEHLPDELIIVSRITDRETNEKILQLRSAVEGRFPLVHGMVVEPGFLPPIRRGIELSAGDVIAFIDDDAEALPDWAGRLLAYYNDADVGGVGGRCINIFDGVVAVYPVAKVVGRIYWFGRAIGNMYRDTAFDTARDVHFLMGGNMSYRRAVLAKVPFDPVIGNNVAFHWELDLGLQVRKEGFRIVFDPMIRVNHYSGPRKIEGLRSVNAEGIYWANFNYSYLMMKHLSPLGRLAYVVYSLLVGGAKSNGVAHVAYEFLAGRRVDWRQDIWPSLKGRFRGAMAHWKSTSVGG